MSLNYSVYIYIHVSPADGDENGSAPAKSGKKKKIAPILVNYFPVVSRITVLCELLPRELVA